MVRYIEYTSILWFGLDALPYRDRGGGDVNATCQRQRVPENDGYGSVVSPK